MHGSVDRCEGRIMVLLKAPWTYDILSLTTLINSDTPFLSIFKATINDDVHDSEVDASKIPCAGDSRV